MDRGQADVLVSDLAKAMGIAELALDENGMGILSIEDGAIIVSIGYNQGAGSLDLMSCLDSVDPTPARIAAALAANFDNDIPGGAKLAAEPTTGAIVLQRRCAGTDLGPEGLPAVVSQFVDQAEAWTKRLLEIDADAAAAPAADGPLPGGIPGGGMRA
jgi:hypothetical protein